VTGATGGVGRRVVALLLQRGKRVRALVRDVAKAKEMLVGGRRAPVCVLGGNGEGGRGKGWIICRMENSGGVGD
jgi:uncharacterized protein YbjT (DUF2867 family)